MPDMNDYAYYAEVVKHGGFAPAGRALRVPKSKLSRRIAALEERLGTRLIERSSRRFRVTEVGQAFYTRCRAMLEEAEQAEALVAQAHSEPQGRVRFSCPRGMVEVLSPGLPDFLARFPKVTLQLIATDRPVDLIAEHIDLALRVRVSLDTDASLTMRTLGRSRRILVAGPQVAAPLLAGQRTEAGVDALQHMQTLASTDDSGEVAWHLSGPNGALAVHRHQPRMTCEDFAALRTAVAGNLGVALLPDHICQQDIAAGRMVQILPEWGGQIGIVHLVFTTRRGLPPAVRALIDHLAATFRTLDDPK
ncbi:LysR substrate-binding domain-containing protein [Novosphingobium sp. BL-8H]|uniref:LysR substrate-binding domain-containing protein n=1 Tax=Novosphingobium sp. BL-8H TaxID=3127640 RepID=UPI0037564DC3